MSDHYEVDGVTVTPLGGGFYELKHPSITAEGGIEKVRGKENADTRAAEIAKAAVLPDGHIEPQGGLDDSQAAAAKDAEIEELKAQLLEANEQREKLLAAAEQNAAVVTTVRASEGAEVAGRVPGGIPSAFVGELSPEAKKALKAAGLGYTKIILEENSDIPPTGLFLGHNGRGYMIQPGEPVDVPDFILGVLNDAKMAAPVTDSKTMKVLGYRERMKYPYRRVD